MVSMKTANNSWLIQLILLPSTYQQVTEFIEDFQYHLGSIGTDVISHK